jgi:hypothetical protein
VDTSVAGEADSVTRAMRIGGLRLLQIAATIGLPTGKTLNP